MSKASKAWYGIRFAAIGSLSKGMGLVNREWGRQYLMRELSRMPGIPAKAAQFLEMKLGVPGWNQQSGKAFPIEWVKERIEAQCPLLARQIEEISEEGITASLGQVHWARLKSGQQVAVKVQYPDLGRQLEEQLDLLISSMGMIPAGKKMGIDLSEYRQFLGEFFAREANYALEAESQGLFRSAWKPLGGVVVPEVYAELGSEQILVQAFEPSEWLDSLLSKPEERRSEVAALLTRLAVIGMFGNGFLHTDLHPRNWGIRERELVLYDFGATLRLDEEVREALREIFLRPAGSPELCRDQLENIGFNGAKLSEIRSSLPEVLQLLSAPFHSQLPWKPSDWKISERLDEILAGDRWWFRAAGPPWFLFLMRGLYGALNAVERLDVPINPQKILQKELGLSFSGASVFKHPLAEAATARSLKVCIQENGITIVDLELPARAVEDLAELIPSAVLESLPGQGIEIASIQRKALSLGLQPQELFSAKYGNRSCRVWLV